MNPGDLTDQMGGLIPLNEYDWQGAPDELDSATSALPGSRKMKRPGTGVDEPLPSRRKRSFFLQRHGTFCNLPDPPCTMMGDCRVIV